MDWQVKQTVLLKALDPQSIGIDERSEIDRLSFAARYSELVLFYDKFNRQQGNWRGFFLKDPVILMAAISKTDYRAVHRQFVYLNNLADETAEKPQKFIALRELIEAMFIDINDWLIQLDNDYKHFHLKAFIRQNVAEPVAEQLQLFIAVLKKMASHHDICCQSSIELFEQFMPLWRSQHKRVAIYEDLVRDDSLWDSLLAIFESLFAFYVQVIDNAEATYLRLKEEINHYPDTALLIAFVQLLDIHRQQLNGITAKHLDFYYQDILKQQPRPVVADEVTLFVGLNDHCDNLELSGDIHFEGPVDDDGQQSIFAVECPQEVNRATISQVRILHCDSTADFPFCITTIEPPAKLITNQPEAIPDRPLFLLADAAPLKLGFVIASPTLYMQGGERKLTVTFEFTGANDWLNDSEVFLSTENGWYKVDWVPKTKGMSITLDCSAPPIEPFGENEQGIPTQWPLLKVLLPQGIPLTKIPKINKTTIRVKVKQAKGLLCHNNDGGLDSDSDFMLFGPIATLGSRFYIEAPELLAKPLKKLTLTFHWAGLMPDFSAYYQQYNQYIGTKGWSCVDELFNNECFKVDIRVAPQHLEKNLLADSVSLFQSSVYEGVEDDSSSEDIATQLETGAKKIVKYTEAKVKQGLKGRLLKKLDGFLHHKQSQQQSSPVIEYQSEPLPLIVCNKKSVFKYEFKSAKFSPMPGLLHQTQAFALGQQSGFIGLELVRPGLGFGEDLYPKVIEYSSLQNGVKQLEAAIEHHCPVEFESMANPPYAPVVQQLTVDYRAKTCIDHRSVNDSKQQQEPYEFYHLDYFSGDLVKQDSAVVTEKESTVDTENESTSADAKTSALGPLPAHFDSEKSTLFLALADLKPPCKLRLYFALATAATKTNKSENSGCYLGDTAWQKLTVLNDQTDHFNHSGTMVIDIPSAISCTNVLMGTEDHWICFNLDENIISRITYVNTQVISAKRLLDAAAADNPVIPSLSAKSIDSTLNASEQIDRVEQPFASFNGKAMESKAAFYQRVSQRIKTKDRASGQSDYVSLALTADNRLYYCKVMPVDSGGKVKLGLVDSCCNPAQTGAFTPTVDDWRIKALKNHISQRISPMVQIEPFNLSHLPVRIKVGILCELHQQEEVFQRVELALKLYLSPWIRTEQPQVEINTDLDEAAIYQFIAGLDGVFKVLKVKISDEDDKPIDFPLDENILMVSDSAHDIYYQEDTL